jgi:hypothetical protein
MRVTLHNHRFISEIGDKKAIIVKLDVSKPFWNLICQSVPWLYKTTSALVLFTSQYIITKKSWC